MHRSLKQFALPAAVAIALLAGCDSMKHKGLSRHAAYPKQTDAITTNAAASRIDIAPRGSSRFAVLGLSASMRASTRRLNPIAALRADTIAARIQPTVPAVIGDCRAASSAPASANGRANTEWLNLTNDK